MASLPRCRRRRGGQVLQRAHGDLAILSISDGWPDPRDAFLHAQWLCQRAQEMGATDELDQTILRSTHRCVEELFSAKSSLNQRRWP